MVPLDLRIEYLAKIHENAKLSAFKGLIFSESFVLPSTAALGEAEEIYFGIIKAIQTGNKSDFEAFYNRKNKSRPNSDSPAPFINDDFLLFSIIVGIEKFKLDDNWIKHIVSIRPRNEITITLENILNKNFESTSNLPEVVLTFLELTDSSKITNKIADFTYEKITADVRLIEERSDFRLLSSIRSYDLIIKLKTIPEGSDIYYLKEFDKSFSNRIRILTFFLQFMVFGFLIFLLINLPKYSPELVTTFEKYNYIFTVLGALGFTILGNQIPLIKKGTKELLMRLLGYPKQLIDLKTAKENSTK